MVFDMKWFQYYIALVTLLFFNIVLNAQEPKIPFTVLPIFELNQPQTLGLSFAKDRETFTIFSPQDKENKYNHGVVLYPFKNMLYAQWQSSAVNEDAIDTQVYYSKSSNGKVWEKPKALTKKWFGGFTASGGWWSHGDTLVAYINVWPNNEYGTKEGYTEFMTSTDGTIWSQLQPVKNREGQPLLGIIEQDVHAFPNGRLITAFHMQPGLKVTPYYTDNPLGILGWIPGKMTNLPTTNPNMSREIEPSWFYRNDGNIVMIFRDQESSFKKLASISDDNGVTWSTPELVDTPDSRAKQSAGNLPDGTAFMVNNPSGNKNRFPLVITLSKDGFVFDKAFLLRSGGADLQPMRYQGKFKRAGYSYPKSVVWGDYLYVAYATNKEDVELTRIPIKSLHYE